MQRAKQSRLLVILQSCQTSLFKKTIPLQNRVCKRKSSTSLQLAQNILFLQMFFSLLILKCIIKKTAKLKFLFYYRITQYLATTSINFDKNIKRNETKTWQKQLKNSWNDLLKMTNLLLTEPERCSLQNYVTSFIMLVSIACYTYTIIYCTSTPAAHLVVW